MPHTCYACHPDNPHRLYDASGALRVPARFAGPPGTANGGIAAGLLACPALRAAPDRAAVGRITARLRRGVPLDRPLAVDVTPSAEPAAYDVTVRDGDDICLAGTVAVTGADLRPGDPLPGPTPSPERAAFLDELAAVVVPERSPFWEETGDHPIPGCFSCGPDNATGLHIYPRLVHDGGLVASPWTPDPSFDDASPGDGGAALSPLIVASALDCSSGICMPLALQRDLLAEDQFFLLGSLDVRYLRVPPLDAAYRVVARAGARDGRKFFGTSVLFDAANIPYATADATWIVAGVTRTEAFGAR